MRRKRVSSAVLVALSSGGLLGVGLGVGGCSGDGSGLDENGRPVEPAPPPVSAFKTIQDTIFTPICSTCHAGASAPRGLRLEDGVAYAALVNQPSSQVPALLRVKPGDPDNSYLVHKIEGRAAVGQRMPLGGAPLPQTSIDLIRQWIADGAAAPTAVASTKTAVSLKAVLPAEEAVLTEAPTAVVVTADGELDATLLDAAHVQLLRSGGDGSFAEGNEVQVSGLSIALRSLDPTVFAISVPAGEWIPERYLLSVAGSGASAVADRNAVRIDGDGDGAPGGDFLFSFEVRQGVEP